MRHDIVFFDLDGTLVDTLPDIRLALNHALGAHGCDELDLSTVRTLVGEGARKLIEGALARSDENDSLAPAASPDAVLDTFRTYYRAHPVDRSRPYPGIVETLDALTAGGATAIVFTNKPGEVARAVLAKLSLAGRFAAIIGDGDGFPRKPDPAAARTWIEKLGVPPDRAAIVGDGVPDVLAARALGATSIACLWGYTEAARLLELTPDQVAATPADLPALLR